MLEWVWFLNSNESSCFSNEIKADVVEVAGIVTCSGTMPAAW